MLNKAYFCSIDSECMTGLPWETLCTYLIHNSFPEILVDKHTNILQPSEWSICHHFYKGILYIHLQTNPLLYSLFRVPAWIRVLLLSYFSNQQQCIKFRYYIKTYPVSSMYFFQKLRFAVKKKTEMIQNHIKHLIKN